MSSGLRDILIWAGLGAALLIPIGAAAFSPLLAWRDPVYIIAGFAGIIGLACLLMQPLLAGKLLPKITAIRQRQLHRSLGVVLLLSVILHVVGLWITSPPDVIDALTFTSATPFSVWGVAAMWAVLAAALLAALRRRVKLRPLVWRRVHTSLAIVTVVGTIIHALLIQGTMEPVTKAILCILVVGATLVTIVRQRIFVIPRR